jgi:hypothetical protein
LVAVLHLDRCLERGGVDVDLDDLLGQAHSEWLFVLMVSASVMARVGGRRARRCD